MVEIDENRLMQMVGKILLELLEDKRLSRDELIALAKELRKETPTSAMQCHSK